MTAQRRPSNGQFFSYLWGVGLFSAFLNILALTGSLFMLQVYDRIIPGGSVPTLVVLFLLAAALFAFYGLLDLFRGRVLIRFGRLVDAILGPEVYAAIVKLPLSRARQENKGELESGEPIWGMCSIATVNVFSTSRRALQRRVGAPDLKT
jgi:ABC-type protease/lipase transport system fused ATPase/permease subunit